MAKNNRNNDGSMSTSEAGRLGGEKVARERGSEFYEDIGSQQGQENNPGNFANDREKARRAGEAGGSSTGNNNNNDR